MFREEDSILAFTRLNADIWSLLKLRAFEANNINACMLVHLKLAFLYDKKTHQDL